MLRELWSLACRKKIRGFTEDQEAALRRLSGHLQRHHVSAVIYLNKKEGEYHRLFERYGQVAVVTLGLLLSSQLKLV